MKALALLSAFCLFFAACSSTESLTVKQPNSTPVLEMSQELVGWWSVSGEMLDFRLYENGLVEFDILDNSRKDPQKTLHQTDELKVTKQTYISESEVEEIVKLLTSDEFLKLERIYRAKRAGTDTSINNTIRFQYETHEKTIEIRGHIEDLASPNPENFPGFPTVLSDLYRQVNKIKFRAAKK
jgi:hypothetical protein